MYALVTTLVLAVLLVFAIASLFVRRHGESGSPQPGWERTDEVFKDPGTDRTMRVWVDRAGGRHYVAER